MREDNGWKPYMPPKYNFEMFVKDMHMKNVYERMEWKQPPVDLETYVENNRQFLLDKFESLGYND